MPNETVVYHKFAKLKSKLFGLTITLARRLIAFKKLNLCDYYKSEGETSKAVITLTILIELSSSSYFSKIHSHKSYVLPPKQWNYIQQI